MKDSSRAEFILAYFKLEEKTNKLINDIEYAKISKKSAKTKLDLYEEFCEVLKVDTLYNETLYDIVENLWSLLVKYDRDDLETYYGCKKNTINTKADQTCKDNDDDEYEDELDED